MLSGIIFHINNGLFQGMVGHVPLISAEQRQMDLCEFEDQHGLGSEFWDIQDYVRDLVSFHHSPKKRMEP